MSTVNKGKEIRPEDVALSTSFQVCPQCGFSHPPLKEGEICPMATQKDEKGKEIDVSDLMINMKNILISQIQIKGVKDLNKFKKYFILNITKLIESYKE